ncbi:hypothetical protein J18TS1_12650 [Oceanobacillus oncorhynchi subsp. incaldanensis]|uniref:hypothetical protein n=1 Tax=Oceanobacillus oncorhynchi TaxID=545501 RepID=UPI001B17E91A|nr:hypothetical protein [Oceanobacillus oncorhynchi]GIO18165.1 hypothetical protein J18TS1_12650 [Oceanobacillus oncorhynchi subsp. incaldanensis]
MRSGKLESKEGNMSIDLGTGDMELRNAKKYPALTEITAGSIRTAEITDESVRKAFEPSE